MRIAVCDDKKSEIEKFCRMIKSAAEEQKIHIEIDEYKGGEQFLFNIQEQAHLPDAIFLDINMPKLNGIEAAKKLGDMDIRVPIVFLTVSEKHFLQAFDVNAFNYILKTQEPEKRIKKILRQLEEKLKWENEDFIMLTVCGEQQVVALEKIYYFECSNKIISLHYKEESLEFYSTLNKIEEDLLDRGFIRIHKSFLVSVSVIASYNRKEMLLRNGVRLSIGRSYYSKVKEIVQPR